jgi:hypothetical protein
MIQATQCTFHCLWLMPGIYKTGLVFVTELDIFKWLIVPVLHPQYGLVVYLIRLLNQLPPFCRFATAKPIIIKPIFYANAIRYLIGSCLPCNNSHVCLANALGGSVSRSQTA